MTASDLFENFLLHDGVKSLRPKENPLIVHLSRQRQTTGGYSANGRFPFVGPWCGVLAPRRWGRSQLPRLCQIPSNFRPGAALTAFFLSL